MTRKLPKDAFYAQFHNHEHHTPEEHDRPFSHEVQDHPAAGENPDYSRKKKHPRKSDAVRKALRVTVGH
jgi:hypothetical protein